MNEDKIKHFDFAKKPHKPSFMLFLAKHLLCFGDLKKRGAQIRKHDMEALEASPICCSSTMRRWRISR